MSELLMSSKCLGVSYTLPLHEKGLDSEPQTLLVILGGCRRMKAEKGRMMHFRKEGAWWW